MQKIASVVTAIKGVQQRYTRVLLRKIDTDSQKEVTEDEVELVVTITQNPRQYKIKDWFWNRQNDVKDGNDIVVWQMVSTTSSIKTWSN